MNEPVVIVRPDDGPIGPKHDALYVLLMVIIFVLDENLNTLFNPLNTELNPICHLLALLGAHHILHVSRIRVNPLNPELNPICYLLALLAHHFLHVCRIRVKS